MGTLFVSSKRQKWYRLKNHYAKVLGENGYDSVSRTIKTCHEVSHLAGCSKCGHTRYILHKCGHRLCPLCSYRVTQHRADLLRRLTAKLQHPKQSTLTIPTQGIDHEKAFTMIQDAFHSLRRDPIFKKIKGGAYSYEVVPHESYYHIHLHLLVDSGFIPRQQLFSAWRKRLEVQYASVDIRSGNTPAAREYIAKYPAKNHAISTDPELICKLYEAIKGRRLFGTFGTWYNYDPPDEDDDNPDQKMQSPCPCCGSTTGFFWIRHGAFIFGEESWRTLEPAYLRGRPEMEEHEIKWVETNEPEKITPPKVNVTDAPVAAGM